MLCKVIKIKSSLVLPCMWEIMSYFTERDAFDTLFDHAPDKLNVVKKASADFTRFLKRFYKRRALTLWLWSLGLFYQTLITFVNKHLNKLNLEVSELETQVTWPWLDHELNISRERCQCLWSLVVCWWCVPGLTDGTPRRILCAPL